MMYFGQAVQKLDKSSIESSLQILHLILRLCSQCMAEGGQVKLRGIKKVMQEKGGISIFNDKMRDTKCL